MQQIIIKQKPLRRKRLKCFDCLHSRTYDSDFKNPIITGRLYCPKWLSVVRCCCARRCPYFEPDSRKPRKKVKRREYERKKGKKASFGLY
jgi:hypothetical protein